MALPSYGGRGSMLYDPQNNYGWQGTWALGANGEYYWDPGSTYLGGLAGQKDAQDNPESYYTRALAEKGYGGFDSRSTAARGLFGRVSDAYGAARLTNNELKFTDFLGNVNIDEMLANMGPTERGENQSNFAPGNVRWLPRQ